MGKCSTSAPATTISAQADGTAASAARHSRPLPPGLVSPPTTHQPPRAPRHSTAQRRLSVSVVVVVLVVGVARQPFVLSLCLNIYYVLRTRNGAARCCRPEPA
eukprot:COSAG01_NODE_58167_length_307_cov_2.480769_1_plen_102_part_11